MRHIKPLAIAGIIVISTLLLSSSAHAAPATFTVTNTNDSGAGSLRQAITDANGNGNPSDMDVISFNIPGSGVHTITPASPLNISEQVTVDGYSQPGASVNTAVSPAPINSVIRVQIDASNISGTNLLGINVAGSQSEIHGLAIYNCADRACLGMQGDGIRIQGNYLGVDASGQDAHAISFQAVGSKGLAVLIGGSQPADRNVIVGSTRTGTGAVSSEGQMDVYGNYIGLARDGVTDLGGALGVLYVGGHDSHVGGTATGQRNVIAGGSVGQVAAVFSQNLVVQGNYIGSDYTGQANSGISNGTGIDIEIGSTDCLIGGTNPGEGNVIRGTSGAGVGVVSGHGSSFGGVVDATKISVLGNTISKVSIFDYPGFGTSNLGIDNFAVVVETGQTEPSAFLYHGPDTNDVADADTGPNNFMNTPVLKSAQQVGNQLTITYDLDAADSPTNRYRVEFFANDESTIFGHGPGQTYLGAATSVAPGTNRTVTLTVAGDVYKKALSATTTAIDGTATSGFGSTSEFAQNIGIGNATDFDADGVTDAVENQAPNNGDGNNDGIPDRLQPTVTSLEIDSTGIRETLATTGCSDNGSVTSVDVTSLSKKDPGKTYPYGLTDFSLNCSRGDTVNVTKYVFVNDQPAAYTLRKYNATTQTYRDVPGSSIASETVGSATALVSRYSITDGGELDDDGSANGVIVDPVGLATTVSLADTGQNVWVFLAGALALIVLPAAALVQARRTRRPSGVDA